MGSMWTRLAYLMSGARADKNDITEPHPQVAPDDLVHQDLGFVASAVGVDDVDHVSPLLAPLMRTVLS